MPSADSMAHRAWNSSNSKYLHSAKACQPTTCFCIYLLLITVFLVLIPTVDQYLTSALLELLYNYDPGQPRQTELHTLKNQIGVAAPPDSHPKYKTKEKGR